MYIHTYIYIYTYTHMGLCRKGGARAGRFVSAYDSGGMLRGMLHGTSGVCFATLWAPKLN